MFCFLPEGFFNSEIAVAELENIAHVDRYNLFETEGYFLGTD